MSPGAIRRVVWGFLAGLIGVAVGIFAGLLIVALVSA